MGCYGKGKEDAQQGKGTKDTDKMTHQEREQYNAGYNNNKK